MRDRDIAALAGRQHNRISRAQLEALGCCDNAIVHRVTAGRLVAVEQAVFAVAPVLDDPWGRWMGATLTAPETYLALWSAGVAYGFLDRDRAAVSVMRPGRAGPRRHGGIVAHRRPDLPDSVGTLRGIPITSPERTLLDLAPHLSVAALARALREAIRLKVTTLATVFDFLLLHPRRRGVRKLGRVAARYAGLPLDRARSGAEVRALLVLRDAGHEVPALNRRVGGIEADLVWRHRRLIVEVDGGPFHLDVGEDARKEAAWRAAGFDVRRIGSDDVYERPARLLSLVPETKSVPPSPS
jgi:hypothetical protein